VFSMRNMLVGRCFLKLKRGETMNGENFTVGFGRDAFRQNIMDYTRETYTAGVDACYWREMLQNSRDAGATRVDATLTVSGSITELIFTDNGRGMTKDVLVNGLLTYAGSVKQAGAAGGFGMAKCLLVFAPNSVKIETNELAVLVEGINCKWLAVDKPIFGTRYTVTIDNEGYEPGKQITPTVEGLKFLMARCDMGNVRVYVNGERINDTKLSDDIEPVRSWDDFKAKAYHLPLARNVIKNRNGENVMVIQHRGIWVEDRVISDEVKGQVWVNIDEEPRKVLNAPRVSVASYDLRSKFDSFLRDIARSPKQALKTKKYTRRWDGGLTTIASAKQAAALMTQALMDAAPTEEATGKRGRPVKLAVDDQCEMLRELAATAMFASGGNASNRVPAEYLEPHRLCLDAETSNEEIAKKLATLVWAPAMMVVNEREQAVDPQFLPETMGRKAKKILTVWSEMIKQFLLLSKAYGCTFGVGFIFSNECRAEWRREDDGTVWFLLNPVNADDKIRFTLTGDTDRAEMIATAAHEVCHEIITNSWHGDDFAVMLTDLTVKALNNLSTFNAIWKIRPND